MWNIYGLDNNHWADITIQMQEKYIKQKLAFKIKNKSSRFHRTTGVGLITTEHEQSSTVNG